MTLGCTMLQFCACLCSMSHVFSCENEVEVDGRTPGPSHDIGLYLILSRPTSSWNCTHGVCSEVVYQGHAF